MACGFIGGILSWKKVDFFEKILIGTNNFVDLLNFGYLIGFYDMIIFR